MHFSYNTTVTGSKPKQLRSISPLQPGWWPGYKATRSVKLNACDGVYLCNYVDMPSSVLSMQSLVPRHPVFALLAYPPSQAFGTPVVGNVWWFGISNLGVQVIVYVFNVQYSIFGVPYVIVTRWFCINMPSTCPENNESGRTLHPFLHWQVWGRGGAIVGNGAILPK